jgi:uncharacterized protein (TIGR02145 family)
MIKYLIFLLCISTSLSAQVMLPAYQGVQGAAISSAITTPVVEVTSLTGRIWMDRNLGATQVATSSTNTASYGDLYQWGRGTDGHQIRTSATTATLSSADQPGNGDFILIDNNADEPVYDWRSGQNANLWQGVNGVNNPCPSGYRLPTDAEWDTERLSWSSQNAAGAFASPLKLPMAGYRYYDGVPGAVGTLGFYWSSSSASSDLSIFLEFNVSGVYVSAYGIAAGASVRCIKD